MANKTVPQLATLSGIAIDDLIPIHDTSETGVEKLKHVTTENLKTEFIAGLSADDHTHIESNVTDLNKYTQTEVDTLIITTSGVLQNDIDNKSDTNHNHDTSYAATSHGHTESDITDLDKYTQAEVDDTIATLSGATASASHIHDDRYYTENEIGNLLADKSDTTHDHGATYLKTDGSTPFAGHILPSMAGASGTVSAFDIGSTTKKVRNLYAHDAYIDAGSLYVNEKKVIEDDSDIITVSTDHDGDIKVKTTGAGIVYLQAGDEINMDAEGGVEIDVPATNSTKHINITNMSNNGNITFSATGTNAQVQFSATDEIDLTAPIVDINGAMNVSGNINAANLDGTTLKYNDATKIEAIDTGADMTGDLYVSNNLTIGGNLTVSGTTTTVHSEELTVTDKIITVNAGETGAGITGSSKAGMEVDRGSETNYRFVFDEVQDNFRVGVSGTEQAVATREDSPTNGTAPVWNSSSNMFVTDSNSNTLGGADTNLNVYDSGLTKTATLKINGSNVIFGSSSASLLRIGKSGDTSQEIDWDANTHVFETNGNDVVTISEEGLTLISGASITAFSTDGDMTSNSDDEVPTVKAVREFVAAELTINKYEETLSTTTDTITLPWAVVSGTNISVHLDGVKQYPSTFDVTLPSTITLDEDAPAGTKVYVSNLETDAVNETTYAIRAGQADFARGQKNIIINGDFNVWQRGTSFSTNSGLYTADRFVAAKVGLMTITALRSVDVPTITQSERKSNYSYQMNITTADTSVASSEFAIILYNTEGYNIAPVIGKTLILSFWVKAALTGIHCISFRNTAGDRSFIREYTINSANTWEKKSVAVPMTETGGTWDYTSGVGLRVSWALAAGSGYQTTADAWQTGNYFSTSNQVNETGTTGNNFRISQIQLEIGDTATEFEYRDLGTETALCQRYYWYRPSYSFLGANALAGQYLYTFIGFNTAMRAAPTVTKTNPVGANCNATLNTIVNSYTGCGFWTSNTGPGQAQWSGNIAFDAEI